MIPKEKNPDRVKGGKAGMASRWHGMRAIVRLDDLTVEQRALVVAIVDGMRRERTAENERS